MHELAGKPLPKSLLADIPKLLAAYYDRRPDVSIASQRVTFGTSGHRGSSLDTGFNENHILAMSQAVCDYRKSQNISGPLFLGKDTHALSGPAFETTLEVLTANGVTVIIQKGLRYTPTPVISHAILTANEGKTANLADGIVITPSHNPPVDGGFKYNPPHGGPAGLEVTHFIESRANQLLHDGLKELKRMPYEKALRSESVREHDYITDYVADLENVLDMKAIAAAKIKIGVDPLGGAAVDYWDPIAKRYGISLKAVNHTVDPAFAFMPADKDGKIRTDCSSPWAMANLINLKDSFDIAFGNDCDADRHGIVTKTAGLMNPNHYLSAAVWYLFQNRPEWSANCAVGKSLVSSAMIDRIASRLGRRLFEVPVGFKWFVAALLDGACGFAGEESAGGSFLKRNGKVWITDKDGIVMGLLACEILAKTGKDPARIYAELTSMFGNSFYQRIDVASTAEKNKFLSGVSPEMFAADSLAGEPIVAKLSQAPGNHEAIGGIKVVTQNGWFAVRPSGTEPIYKIYAESFNGESHLEKMLQEAQAMINAFVIPAKAGIQRMDPPVKPGDDSFVKNANTETK